MTNAVFITNTDQREKEIMRFLPLVKQLVGKIIVNVPSFVDEEDLIEVGIVGLIAAIDSYQSCRGANLKTHVYARIKGSILDEIRKLSCFPKEFYKKVKQLEDTFEQLKESLQRIPNLGELEEAMQISSEELDELLTALRSRVVLSLGQDPEKKGSIASLLAFPGKNAQELTEQEELKEKIAQAISELPEREKEVIVLYYYEGLLLQEIAKLLQISPGRVSHLHTRALYIMKQSFDKKH
ncbi:MAG: sigma-70 family RNA polymerase sigma factor [Candidatus Brocadiae bacterium]|nr:sigma-70 family RNA polymerase sigma factor [Candidatus Brocadiia bacterium]